MSRDKKVELIRRKSSWLQCLGHRHSLYILALLDPLNILFWVDHPLATHYPLLFSFHFLKDTKFYTYFDPICLKYYRCMDS